MRPIRWLLVSVLALALGARPHAATAAGRFVTNTSDSGAGSLREAIGGATAGDVVVFDAAVNRKTITLTSGQIVIDKNLSIVADVGTGISVSGNRSSRVFQVNGGVTAVITGLTIRDGSVTAAGPGGGGIYNLGNLTLVDSTVTGNLSTQHAGGIQNSGTMSIGRSTVSENIAQDSYGGGIGNYGGPLVIVNSTISGNVAGLFGGGIDNYGDGATTVTAFLSTIAFNYAAVSGGGFNGSDDPQHGVSLAASILANNNAPTGPDCVGTPTSLDYNVIGRTKDCAFTGTTTNDLVNVDPLLGALQMNGGASRTHALRPGSPAMDRVPSAACTALAGHTEDSRRLARPQDGGATFVSVCDVGAYEAKTPIVVNSLSGTSDVQKCTLVDALSAATFDQAVNGCAAGTALFRVPDRIVFNVKGRIRTNGGLQAGAGVMLDGPGAAALTIAGGFAGTVLDLEGGDEADDVFVVDGLTLADGKSAIGGGLVVQGGAGANDTLAIDRVDFVDDFATTDASALLLRFLSSAEIDSSSISSTVGSSLATAIYTADLPLTIRNSTIGETGGGDHTALYARNFDGGTSRVRIIGCTFRGSGTGHAVFSYGSASVVEYGSSIFAGHGSELISAAGGSYVSLGYNIVGDASAGPAGPGDLSSTDPKLGLHVWGGGPTRTMAPLVGSPAIDAIPYLKCAVLADQRGAVRPLDGDRSNGAACDIGAVETAPPIVVDSLLDTNDPLKCGLRDAIAAASVNAARNGCPAGLVEAPDLVTFAVQGTISLGSLPIAASGAVELRGPGARKLAIFGGAGNQITLSSTNGRLTISGLELYSAPVNAVGEASVSTLSIAESYLHLIGGDYGAVSASESAVQLLRTTLSDGNASNTATMLGFDNSEVVVDSCSVYNAAATALLITNYGTGRTAHLRVKNSTIFSADVGVQAGTAFFASPSDVVAEYSGTIFSGNTNTNFKLTNGTGISRGYNIGTDGTGNLVAAGDHPSTNPLLGPLSYHGGQTAVFTLLSGSPARDAIPTSSCGQGFDQRGLRRPYGMGCDIGAMEKRLTGDVNNDDTVDVLDVFYLINTLFAGGPAPIGDGDANADAAVDVLDVFYLVNNLFAGGPAPV